MKHKKMNFKIRSTRSMGPAVDNRTEQSKLADKIDKAIDKKLLPPRPIR